MRMEAKLEELGLVLPEPAKLPPGENPVQANIAECAFHAVSILENGRGRRLGPA